MNDNFMMTLEENGAETKETLSRFLNDKEMYYSFIKEFLVNTSLIKLYELISTNDFVEIYNEIHTIKGVALNLGLTPIGLICMDILKDFKNNKNNEAIEQIPNLIGEFNRWILIAKRI